MNRKDIKAILPEIADDDLRKVLDLFHSEIDTIKDEKDDIQRELDKAKSDLTAANAAKEKAEGDFADYKNQQAKAANAAKKEAAYKKLLAEAGIGEKHISLIARATDMNTVELDESGAIKESEKLSESIKKDYADYISSTSVKGASVSTPPANAGSAGKYKNKEEIMAIKDSTERQAAIAENHEWFGF